MCLHFTSINTLCEQYFVMGKKNELENDTINQIDGIVEEIRMIDFPKTVGVIILIILPCRKK